MNCWVGARQLIFIIISALPLTAQQPHTPSTTDWQQLVPSAALPDSLHLRPANNNLDLTYYKGRYYLAFRNAPNHFASAKTRLHLMSTTDFEQWTLEKTYYLEADLREPRFLVFRDTLFFYFFEAGTNPLRFEPHHLWVATSTGEGQWTPQQDVGLDGYVPWRVKARGDTVYLSGYYGKSIYDDRYAGDMRLFVSTNGKDFSPISPYPQLSEQIAAEFEFEFDTLGNLWGTVRLEGSGAYIVYADKDSLADWQLQFTHDKYDSALLFEHEGEFYLISRRHPKGPATPQQYITKRQRRRNLLRYSLTEKKTALFWLDKKNRRMVHLMDFPSTGDTAIAGLARKDAHSYYLVNYSNDIHGRPMNWIDGQLQPTHIYWTVLRLE